MAAEYVAWENSKVNFEEFLPFFWKQEEPEGCSISVEWKFGTNCIVVVFESGVATCSVNRQFPNRILTFFPVQMGSNLLNTIFHHTWLTVSENTFRRVTRHQGQLQTLRSHINRMGRRVGSVWSGSRRTRRPLLPG